VSPRIKILRPLPPISGGVKTVPFGSVRGSREVWRADRRVRGFEIPWVLSAVAFSGKVR